MSFKAANNGYLAFAPTPGCKYIFICCCACSIAECRACQIQTQCALRRAKVKKSLTLLTLLAPLVAIAGEPDHLAICDELKPDITRSYGVHNLNLVDNGSSYVSGEGVVLCVYDGIIQKFYADRSVRVMATLNIANNKYNVLF